VFLNGSRHFVFVEQAPGQFVRVEVKADGEAGGVMLVRDGLSVGQKVVVDGALFLQQILLAKGAA
jgi:cobalt-zinc-cadmium efflux system membrane fusion protein